jgi:hypothetical protein
VPPTRNTRRLLISTSTFTSGLGVLRGLCRGGTARKPNELFAVAARKPNELFTVAAAELHGAVALVRVGRVGARKALAKGEAKTSERSGD